MTFDVILPHLKEGERFFRKSWEMSYIVLDGQQIMINDGNIDWKEWQPSSSDILADDWKFFCWR